MTVLEPSRMNKVTLLAIIALTMVGSLVFKAWQRAPVLAMINPQPKAVAVASASVTNEEFRARLRQIVARAKAASAREHPLAEKSETSDIGKSKPEKPLNL